LMAVNPNKQDDAYEGESEGLITSKDGNAWEHILRSAGVGFKEYYAWVTVRKCCDTVPEFPNTLRKMIDERKDGDLVEGIPKNSPSTKDSLEEAISKELHILFGNAIQKEIGKMPANKDWENWLEKHKKHLEVNVDGLTVEDLKMRRKKNPQMSQTLRLQMLSALQKGDIVIVDNDDVEDVVK
jgi:hypothetical protein